MSFHVVVIAALSIIANLAANLVSARLGFFGPFVAPLGVFFFPFVYILSDITSEVWGYRISRWIAWITVLANLLFTGTVLLATTVTSPAPWCIDLDNAIKMCMSSSVRVIFAGIAGSVLGGWVNDIVFQYFRHKDGTYEFAKRKLLSSLGGEIVDTSTFITLAFLGTEAWSIQLYIVQFILKYAVEVVTEPLAHWTAGLIRFHVGESVFEDRNKFNIFGFRR